MAKETALVVGKFMPLHRGHHALIEFALEHCDELVLLVCAVEPGEPVPGHRRLDWVRQAYGRDPRIRVEYTEDPLPGGRTSTRTSSAAWGHYCKARWPEVTLMVSSEPYGRYMAETMGCRWLDFDPDRTVMPVSGTAIRSNPYRYWEFLDPAARPDFLTRVCLYGPESVGKTTIARQLAEDFGTLWVPETARAILGDRHCTRDDFEEIAATQLGAVRKAEREAPGILFCDTDLLTTLIYAETYFGDVPPLVRDLATKERYNLRLLLTPDVPWAEDSQRDLGHRRQEMFERFRSELMERQYGYAVVGGGWDVRYANARAAVDRFLAQEWY